MNIIKQLVLVSLLSLLLLLFAGCSSPAKDSTEPSPAKPVPVSSVISTEGAIKIQIDVTGYGLIGAELYPKVAPKTVANFTKLISEGFYNGLTFHRIINGFMIQGGDPLGNGHGNSSATIPGEFSNNGFPNSLSHTRGVLSMARGETDMNSASSQFFIVQQDSTFLDGDYASFGIITSGMAIVDSISANIPVEDDNGTVLPSNQPIIKSIVIIK